jgi:hypothetical protein
VAGAALTDPAQLAKFREVQQLAYAAAESVGQALQPSVTEKQAAQRIHRSPLWAYGEISNHPATPGLWAVEPHIGLRDVGVKFEEILVVASCGDAYWLDDDVPHVRRWQRAAAAS